MPGGGYFTLVAYGSQNVILSGNPQMTYYYKLYKRYSHFAMESIELPLEGPNQLQWDKGIQLRAKITRYGDLLSDMYFSFRIPDIYSKFTSINSSRQSQYIFQWTRFVGLALINRVSFFIGGQRIQEFDGTYLMTKAMLEYDIDTLQKWKDLVGDVPDVVNPAQGAYSGGFDKTAYPTVYPDANRQAAGQAQANRPSIPTRDIHVPLNFWFTDATTQSLPLVGLQYQECEVQLDLNPVQALYNVLDPSGYRVAPAYRILSPTAYIQNNIPDYVTTTDSAVEIRNFLQDYYQNPTALNTWENFNPRLQCTYTYLAEEEQKVFATRPLTYIFPQLTMIPQMGVYNQQIFDLDVHNPITRIIFVPRRSDWIYRNDFNNFTNWYTYPFAPFRENPTVSDYINKSLASGLAIPNSQKDIIRTIRVLVNGNQIQDAKPGDFFQKINPYRYTTGYANSELPFYTWALTSSKIQPSGSLNASRVQNLQVEIDVWPPPSLDINNVPLAKGLAYTYDIMFYVESLNFLVVASGSGAPKYVL